MIAKNDKEIEINAELLASLIKRLYEEKRRVSQYDNTYTKGEN